MGRRAWGVLFVLCGTIFLEGLDVSMMGVALPSIQSDLGVSTNSLQWVVSAYVLGYGGFTLLGGRAADLLGRRQMFLFWLTVFLLFSGLGGFATKGWLLIVARFVTGVSAGFMTPAALSIITTSFAEGRERNRALLVFSAAAAAGFSLGLVVGGLLTEIDWRWVFFAPVLMASALLISAVRLIPDPGPVERSTDGYDLGGAVTVTAAMLLFVFAVVKAPDVAWTRTLGTLALSGGFLAAFVIIERHAAAPLVWLGILRSSTLVRNNLSAMLFVGSFSGFQFIAVLYLQTVRGWSALETGLALLVAGIDAVLAPTLTPRLVDRFGVVRVILAGSLVAATGYALFLPIGLDSAYATAMFPTMLLTGIAFALVYGPLTIAATSGIVPSEQGLAGGLLNSSIQFGTAIGLAVMTAVHVAAAGPDGSPQALLDGYRAALVVPVIATLLAATITLTGLRTPGPERRREAERVG
ncbi:MAG: MFS transporter [Chloroflexota bacterium]|nr:MFS transporter [Chloroflexota bacterium]